MEFLVASGVGVMTAAGTYLLLRGRTFPVIVGLSLLSYAINVFLFATGRLVIDRPPIISETAIGYTDPLPQALVLTAIVISFGMTALVVVLALLFLTTLLSWVFVHIMFALHYAHEYYAEHRGKGGGKPDMAQAGGPDGTKLDAALKAIRDSVATKLAS